MYNPKELQNVHEGPHADDSSRTWVWTIIQACNIW